MLNNFLWVALGGSIGAMLRYGISIACVHFWGNSFPWGTFVANTIGCLAMGILVGLGLQKDFETSWLLLGVGVLGALTTFSTFSAETLQLAIDGRWLSSVWNVTANVFACLVACFAGIWLSRLAGGS